MSNVIELNATTRAATLLDMATARYREAILCLRRDDPVGYLSRLRDVAALRREARRLLGHQARLDEERRRTAAALSGILELAAKENAG